MAIRRTNSRKSIGEVPPSYNGCSAKKSAQVSHKKLAAGYMCWSWPLIRMSNRGKAGSFCSRPPAASSDELFKESGSIRLASEYGAMGSTHH